MVTPRRADGEPVEQLAKADRNPELQESVDAMRESLHEDTALRIDAENFGGSREKDSKACVDRRGEAACVESRRKYR